MTASLLIRGGRILGLDGEAERVADMRIHDGIITEVGPDLAVRGEPVVDADGAWLIPGLWDSHVHFGQWARSTTWIALDGTAGPDDVCARVAAALSLRRETGRITMGFGYRSATWERLGTVDELDAVTGSQPVVLISGDAHNGWLNSAALSRLGLPHRTGPMTENEWFTTLARLTDLPEQQPTHEEEAAAVALLRSRGLAGLVDLEFTGAFRDWPARVAAGIRGLRVRTGVYQHQLDEVLEAGWRTGDVLPGGDGLITMGPLKIISDGSLGTRTAWCCEPYVGLSPQDPHAHGAANLTAPEMRALLSRARDGGLTVAVHAIGDRANQAALDAFADTGARGSIEHAQLLRREDVARFAQLGLTASMQPLHAVEDREMTQRWWADRADRTFLLRSLLDAGASLSFSSDAPVSPPDPWLAMAAAVHRSGDDRPPIQPEEQISAREALASSVDGQRIRPGAPGDLVLLGTNPLAHHDTTAETAEALKATKVLATVCAGEIMTP
ncbi:MAG: amidohydrolase family protein [Propionibacteriaceae bacterium]|nr:amidohydrolase family protein [Propionibacteriaceae bacterium]